MSEPMLTAHKYIQMESFTLLCINIVRKPIVRAVHWMPQSERSLSFSVLYIFTSMKS